MNDVYVTLLGAHVQPFAAYGQMYASDTVNQRIQYTYIFIDLELVRLIIVTVRVEI